jgi:hypothetical protein
MNNPFLASANQQLSAAGSLLLQQPPEPKSLEASRLAVEMFLKAYLCIHHGFTEEKVRKYSHRLDDILKAVCMSAPNCELQQLTGHLSWFPAVDDRYAGKQYTGIELWRAYRTALFAGACVARSVSIRNLRHELGLVFS